MTPPVVVTSARGQSRRQRRVWEALYEPYDERRVRTLTTYHCGQVNPVEPQQVRVERVRPVLVDQFAQGQASPADSCFV